MAAPAGEHDHGRSNAHLTGFAHKLEPVLVFQEVVHEVDVVLLVPQGVDPLLVGGHPIQLDLGARDLADQHPCHLEIALVVVDQEDADGLGGVQWPLGK